MADRQWYDTVFDETFSTEWFDNVLKTLEYLERNVETNDEEAKSALIFDTIIYNVNKQLTVNLPTTLDWTNKTVSNAFLELKSIVEVYINSETDAVHECIIKIPTSSEFTDEIYMWKTIINAIETIRLDIQETASNQYVFTFSPGII